jgi:transcriptional regulator of heat shock response
MKSILEVMNTNSEKVEELEGSAAETKSEVEQMDTLVKQLQENTAWIRMGETEDGEAYILLGSQDSNFQLVITQTKISFMEGDESPAYMSNKTMVITKAYVKDQLQIGTMAWVKRQNRHISFMGVSEDGGTE